jgi:hypothetical protein
MDCGQIRRSVARFPGRSAHAVGVRALVGWLSLMNRFARYQIRQPRGPVVSLTTHGDRVFTVHLAIESIGRGELRPSRVILWLDDAATFSNLPVGLRRLQKRGLEVRLCKNYGPHTKYYPYVAAENLAAEPLVTADDDILYPSYWLKKLVEAYREFPETVNCYRARVVTVKGRQVMPYYGWTMCTNTESSFRYLATGVSGVIYAPHFLMDIKAAGEAFEDCCPEADDLWLHVQALRSGLKIRQIGKQAIHFPIIPGTQKSALYVGNFRGCDGNDRQIKATYTLEDFNVLLKDSANPHRSAVGSAMTVGDGGKNANGAGGEARRDLASVRSSIYAAQVAPDFSITGGGLDGR